MNNIKYNRRLPAEWESDGAILLAWPHSSTDWSYMLDEVQDCYVRLIEAIVTEMPIIIISPELPEFGSRLSHIDKDRLFYCSVPTNDTWTRDFGPISVEDNGETCICDFKFNAWGLKFAADSDNLVTGRLYEKHLLRGKYVNCLNFVLEGGSIESDGKGTIMTTSNCLLSANRNGGSNKMEIEEVLREKLGSNHFLWLDHGSLAGDDTDSHIDTLARFAPHDTIVYVGCHDKSDPNYESLKLMKAQLHEFVTIEGNPYSLLELPSPEPICDENGQQLPATYANYLVTPNAIFMPAYGQPDNDRLAAGVIEAAYGIKVIAIDCRPLIRQHGSLHCATMQLPKDIINI